MAKGFAKISTGSADVNRVEEKVRNALKQGLSSVEDSVSSLNAGLANGKLLEITLTSTATDFRHGLGRKVTGYIVVETDTAINTPVRAASGNESLYINLQGSAASAAVKLWVF